MNTSILKDTKAKSKGTEVIALMSFLSFKTWYQLYTDELLSSKTGL